MGGAGPGGGSGSGGQAGSAGGAGGSGGAAELPLLEAPPAGKGVQIDTGHFDVPAGSELAGCHFFAVKDLAASVGLDPSQPLNVSRIQIAQLAGTHDMTLYEVRTVGGLDPANGPVQVDMNGKGPCYDETDTADWPVMANSLQPEAVDWKFPDGVAYSLDPDRWVMVKTHYANSATQKTPDGGRVKVNLWAIPAAQVTAQVGTVRTTRKSVRVCQSNPAPKFEGACTFGVPSDAQILGANVLTHGRGVAARLWTWDGVSPTTPADADVFYESKAWDAPLNLAWPALTASSPAMGGFWLRCDYAWQPPPSPLTCGDLDAYDAKTGQTADCCYDDGPQIDLNERCSATVYYWPKSDLVNCL